MGGGQSRLRRHHASECGRAQRPETLSHGKVTPMTANSGFGSRQGGTPSGSQEASLVDRARDAAGDTTARVRDQLEGQIGTAQHRAADGLGDVARALRRVGDELRSESEQTGPAPRVLEEVAGRLERASQYFGRANVRDVLHEAESLARREPALFLGGAFVLGLLGARFLKSSAERQTGSSRPLLGSGMSPRGHLPRDTFGDRFEGGAPYGGIDRPTPSIGTGGANAPTEPLGARNTDPIGAPAIGSQSSTQPSSPSAGTETQGNAPGTRGSNTLSGTGPAGVTGGIGAAPGRST